MSHLRGPAALLALCICFYWKLALTDQYVWFDHPDMVYLEIPRLQFQANELHRGQFPLWDPRIWAGQPLIGQTQPGPLYPFNLIFAAMPLVNGGYIRLPLLNWYWIFIHFQAALFCYWLARDLGRTRMASIIAGCIFSFAGFVGTAAWLDVANGAVWTPLVVLFLLRSIRAQGSVPYAALAGFTLGVAWLCGHHEIPMLVSYLCALTWLFYIVRGRNWMMARAAAVFFVMMFLTSAAQTIPTYEFGRISHRWIGLENTVGWKDAIPYIMQTTYSMPVRGILGLALFGVNEADSSTYTGVLAVGLALLGMIAGWRLHPAVRWLAAVTGVTLIYALGNWTPLQGLFYSFAPMLGKARVPIRAVHLVHFGIAVLAAYGVDLLADRDNRWARRIALSWLWFGGIIVAAAIWQTAQRQGSIDERVMLSGWVAIAAGGFTLAYRRDAIRWLVATGCLLALALIEMTSAINYPNRHQKDGYKFVKAFTEHQEVATFLKMQPWPFRAAVNDSDVPMNFGDWHGFDMLQGYVAGATDNLLLHGLHTPETRRLFAVTYWVSKQPERPDQQEVYKGFNGLNVYKNPDAMPRAWAAHEAVRVKDNLELQKLIHDPQFNPWRTVAMLNGDAPKLETCEGSSSSEQNNEVKVVRHHSNRISLRADMKCRGMVIVADTFYPGWRATVDGKPAEIREVYGALRGIVVDSGAHEIEMRFQPLSVYGGAGLTMFGTMLAVVAWRRRK